jgi:hypothetical protein
MQVLHWYKNLIILELKIPCMDKKLIGKKIKPDNKYLIELKSEDTAHVYIDPNIYGEVLKSFGGKLQLNAYIISALTFA